MITEIKELEQKIERDRKVIKLLLIGLLISLLGSLGTMAIEVHALFK
jgi:hypothetical protein